LYTLYVFHMFEATSFPSEYGLDTFLVFLYIMYHLTQERTGAVPTYRIIVDISDRRLHLLSGNRVIRTFPVGIGTMLNQTPSGAFTIVNKVPKPGGFFGAFWMGLSKPHYGIHGTNNPSSIGKMSSHGCIRMYNKDVITLSKLVSIGTHVTIRH
jgi:lipoprotein-anchoring transpeptidase ErfK/SrfK